MASIDRKPFERPDGTTDWDGLKKAQKANGESCDKCGAYILFGGKGYRETCHECRQLSLDGDVTHKRLVRCPHCAQSFNGDDYEMFELYNEGSQDVSCPYCDEDFQVVVHISYSFESPPLIVEGAEKSEDD